MPQDSKPDRRIFRYNDGTRDRAIDPFRVYRALWHDPTHDIVKIAPLADMGQEPEATQFFALLRKAFELPEFDPITESGLTDWETAELFNEFSDWLDAQKKSTESGPISLPPTGSESSTNQEPLPEAASVPSDSSSAPIASGSGGRQP